MNWRFWENAKPAKPQYFVKEWFNSIVFAVVAATLIRSTTVEAFVIPTPSMENSLLVGDFLFVSKFHYGTRTPKTPLQIPLTHQKIWRSEERRVGKECRSRWWRYDLKKKEETVKCVVSRSHMESE